MTSKSVTSSLALDGGWAQLGSLRRSMARSVAASESSIDSVSHLLRAADMSQARSMKALSNLSRLAQIEGERQLRNEEKAAAREVHDAAHAALQEEERIRREQKAAQTAAQRKAAQDEADRVAEEIRAAALRKKAESDERTAQLARERAEQARKNKERAAAAAERRNATSKASMDTAESRRRALQARQDAAAQHARERENIKLLDLRIKEEEAFLRQEARLAAKAKAEAEAEQKRRIYEQQQKAKGTALANWERAAEVARQQKIQEASLRASQVREKVLTAAEADRQKREIYRSVTTSKAERADAIASERERLANSMHVVRHSMQMQESSLRASLELMRTKGISFRMPARATASLSEFSSGIASTLEARRTLSVKSRPSSAVPATQRPASSGGPVVKVRPASATVTTTPAAGPASTSRAAPYNTAGPAPPNALEKFETELRRMLQEEIDKESERQATLSATADPAETARLAQIFAAEREAAKQRILALSASVHEAAALVHAASPANPAPGAALGAKPAKLQGKSLMSNSSASPPPREAWTVAAVPAGGAAQ